VLHLAVDLSLINFTRSPRRNHKISSDNLGFFSLIERDSSSVRAIRQSILAFEQNISDFKGIQMLTLHLSADAGVFLSNQYSRASSIAMCDLILNLTV
jgi:hypothetical protein